MKYSKALIPVTLTDMRASISTAMLRCPKRHFEHYEDFDGVFFCLMTGVENLRPRLGETKARQLIEMLTLAKGHYEAGDSRLGGALMEDAKMLVIGRQPWAYPQEPYRWPRDPALPELSESDYSAKEVEGE